MRFNVEIELANDRIPKDKNRVILSFIKHCFQSYDEDYYNSLYQIGENMIKPFTFALYMPGCHFTREEIVIPDKKIILNFSTYNMEDGIMFYNSILENIKKEYKIKDNTLKVIGLNLRQEKPIINSFAIYKTMSPVVAREHDGDNRKTWYYSLDEEKGREIFKENLKHQLIDVFGEERIEDIEELDFQILNNKTVKVKHYDIEVLSNISRFKIFAKPYILDYIYKAGIGSRKSTGFGMLDLI